jgi:hypothetical protein
VRLERKCQPEVLAIAKHGNPSECAPGSLVSKTARQFPHRTVADKERSEILFARDAEANLALRQSSAQGQDRSCAGERNNTSDPFVQPQIQSSRSFPSDINLVAFATGQGNTAWRFLMNNYSI